MSINERGNNGEQAAANFLADVQLKLLTLMDERKISRSELASRLGVVRSRVTRLLGAESNMTVLTLGRIFEALGEVPEVSCTAFDSLREVEDDFRASGGAEQGHESGVIADCWAHVVHLEAYRRHRPDPTRVRFEGAQEIDVGADGAVELVA